MALRALGYVHLGGAIPESRMCNKADPKQGATVEELLRACLYEQEAPRRVLVRKGLLTNEEVLEEVKVVRRELDGKRGR